VGIEKKSESKASCRFFVIVVSALFIFGGFSVLTSMNASADDPVPVGDTTITPAVITMPETFDAEANFTHAGTNPIGHGINYSSGRIFISETPGVGCTGDSDTALVKYGLQPGRWIVYVENYDPYGSPFFLGSGMYDVYFYVADNLTFSACHNRPGILRINAPDSTPPLATNHDEGPPGFPPAAPQFSVNPATTETTLYYQINDMKTGNGLITAAEHFYCQETVLGVPCGPDHIATWVNGSGTPPDDPLMEDPWEPFPPPIQQWNFKSRMYFNATINVTLWPAGNYWFYIHGADCGEDELCMSGAGDDNWGKDKGIGDHFFEIMLTVGTSANAPLLEWTGESGYETDGVDPNSGPLGTNFTYKVKYSDKDGDPPQPTDDMVRTWIHKPCGDLIAGNPYIMSWERWVGDPDNYTQGAIYNVTVQLSPAGNDYAYNFSAFDGVYMATGEPTFACSDGPNVTSTGNNPPVLSWTGIPGPFETDGVDPDSGDPTTLFEFRVNYTDADDDPPTPPGYIDLYIERPCGADWEGPFAMNPVNPGDTTYTDGALFNYSRTLPDPSPFTYGYRFEAHDGTDPATGGTPVGCTPGPVFGGVTPPPPPSNLWVERGPADMIVHWDAVVGADEYNVYIATNDRFIPFPWPVSTELTTSFTHGGAGADANTYFYIVRAYNTTNALESTNSTMGVKLYKSFGIPTSPLRNIYWMSLPYNSMYKKAKDITDELTETNINAVCKWQPSKQNSRCYTYWAGRWRGPNFDILPGDGISVNSINTWTWVINGTDMSYQLDFTTNPKGNIYRISLPYTNSYMTANDIVFAIEGPLMQSTKIKAVALWVPAAQAYRLYYWDIGSGMWIGDNFSVRPGDGYYLDIVSNFPWTPDLITPAVP
jgi:hypothetical protein